MAATRPSLAFAKRFEKGQCSLPVADGSLGVSSWRKNIRLSTTCKDEAAGYDKAAGEQGLSHGVLERAHQMQSALCWHGPGERNVERTIGFVPQ